MACVEGGAGAGARHAALADVAAQGGGSALGGLAAAGRTQAWAVAVAEGIAT